MITQSKSLLAKLLASENITVEHRKTRTAYFDTKNRVMVLPIWKDMSVDLYDLLLGHETGHALFTPSEGWHDAVVANTSRAFKTFLNVIEDVRIEKQIQAKFPGLKACFTRGYDDLVKKDFFGVSALFETNKVDTLPFIDRINLHYKLGSHLNIKFSDSEKPYLKRLDNLKRWEDTEALVLELFALAKEELRQQLMDLYGDDNDGDGSEYDDDDYDEVEDYEEGPEDGSVKIKRRTRTFVDAGSDKNYDDEDEPFSRTDRHFRNKEKDLLSDNVQPYVYANLPKANLDNIIVPYTLLKDYHNNFMYRDITTGMVTNSQHDETILARANNAKTRLYKEFQDTNKKYIAYLVKEFEMRRNARQFARASISKTGSLDLKKIYSYRINDDLFKRISVVPNGKSHGLVMFIDYSGSMVDNIEATIEQTIVLATFCRKVNIPFRVYAFTDDHPPEGHLAKELQIDGTELAKYFATHDEKLLNNKLNKFSNEKDELVFNSNKSFRLREYLSSEMSGLEFKEAVRYWLLVGKLFGQKTWLGRQPQNMYKDTANFFNSHFEDLNGTPLNEAIAASIDIVEQFKKKYKLDVVNTVFLTDGDANESNQKYTEEGVIYEHKISSAHRNLVIRDLRRCTQAMALSKISMTQCLLDLLKQSTGCNVIGFYLTDMRSIKGATKSKLTRSNIEWFGVIDNYMKNFRKNKFVMLNNIGYDDLYIIPGGRDLSIDDDGLDVKDGSNKTELKKAFMKMQKGKVTNRVLLSRFVEKIA